MRALILAVILLIALLQTTHAQNPDSLKAVWQDTNISDSVRMGAYEKYIWNTFLFSAPDSAIMLAEALHQFAEERRYPKAASVGFNLQGIANAIMGNYPVALQAMEKSFDIDEQQGDKKSMAVTLSNIGSIYKENRSHARALQYYEKSLPLHEELSDSLGLANVQNNMGGIYMEMGNHTLAMEHYEKALAIFEKTEDKRGVTNALANIGSLYQILKNYDRALDFLERAKITAEEIGEEGLLPFIMSTLGSTYNSMGKYSLAVGPCKKSLALAEEIGNLNQQFESCECLYEAYKALGKENLALQYNEKGRAVEEIMDSEEMTRKLEQMEFAKVMYEDSIANEEESRLVREAHQAEVRKKNQTRNYLIAGGLLALILAGGIFNRLRYTRKSKAVLQVEKDRSENLLLNILPAEIAEELKAKGRADARDFDMVSILFTDFKGFTEASAKLSAQDLVAEINACFEVFDGIMAKYGVEKIKTIGDAYMAAGGLPIPQENSVKNTVLAALEMQDFIEKRKVENNKLNKPAFEMRAGVHTGPVVAGIVGVKKFQYDIWGDTVNTASRMETNSEPGKVNVSQSTYELLKNDNGFVFEPRGKVEAKGKGEIEMYFVSKI